MKRIAILAPYVGVINRGAETFVIELASSLKNSFIIDIYSTAIKEDLKGNIIKVNVNKGFLLVLHEKLYNKNQLYRKIINKFYFIIPDVIYQKKFSKLAFKKIENENYDLIFPNNGYWGAYYAKKIRYKKNTPFIYTGHGGIGFGEKKILECEPDYYICLTPTHLTWAKENIVRNTKIILIPNGVHVANFNNFRRKDNNKKTVISVGALTEFKRHQLTIRAISKLKDVDLIILGKGEEEKNLRNLASKLLPNRFLITSVSYNEVKKYYEKADLFVLPSKDEPFGIVYLEAMASNLPIVAPNDSARMNLIDNAGLFCDVCDINEYAEYITKALNTDFGDLPRERAKKYDWNAISDKYKLLINELLLMSEEIYE